MKRWIKVGLAIIGVPIVIVAVLASVYLIRNIQGVVEPYQLGNPDARYKVLIASQGSTFKNKLLENLIHQLQGDSLYLSIVDCTSLDGETKTEWDATIIIHTTQIHGMPEAARSFLETSTDLSKVVLVTTSGGGDEAVTEFDVDAISTASRISSTDKIADWAALKVKNILVSGFSSHFVN